MNVVLPVTVAVEGPTDVPVVRRVLSLVGCSVHVVHGRSGKDLINRNLLGYNNAARFSPWLVLRDLDHDADCAAQLVANVLPNPAAWMRLRIAVRATECWLLADSERISRFLRVKRSLVPADPEQLADPKGALVNLARRSHIASVREDIVPSPGMSSRVGPGYVSRISEFALNDWRPDVAMNRSDSLRRCIERVREFSAYLEVIKRRR